MGYTLLIIINYLHFDSLLKYNKTKKEKIKDIRKFTFLTFTIVINISAIYFILLIRSK